MNSYALIPVLALTAYISIFLAFMVSEKNSITKSFINILVAMILWTAGSLFMRLQLPPGIDFWFNISIVGIFALPSTYLIFIRNFLGSKKNTTGIILNIAMMAIILINFITGIFIAPPKISIGALGVTSFVYETNLWLAVPILVALAMIVQMFVYVLASKKRNMNSAKQVTPLMVGAVILLLANAAVGFPWFNGIPLDIMAGVINAILLLYMISQKRLFKLKPIVSKGTCYGITATVSFIIGYYALIPFKMFLVTNLPMLKNIHDIISISAATLTVIFIYSVTKKLMDSIFTKEESASAESIKNFSSAVSKSLKLEEILEETAHIIEKHIDIKSIHICVENHENGDYITAYTTNILSGKTFLIKNDSPLIEWLKNYEEECVIARKFKQTIEYKSMWEEEKFQLSQLNPECFVALRNEEELVGILMLGQKKKGHFSQSDMDFLSSISSVASIALKNSRMYEKACEEARTDELTGLYNRKYFHELIKREYERSIDNVLALMIINIDDFKLYNQLYGNKEGDIALQNVARIIKNSVGYGGFAARITGKEFAAILPSYDILRTKRLAENIRNQIADINRASEEYAYKTLTVSIGICAMPFGANTVEELLHNADLAVYSVKRTGKNDIMVYEIEEPSNTKIDSVDYRRTADAYSEYETTINALTAAIDAKDHYTFTHSNNVAYYSTELGLAAGLSEEYIEIVREAALLHDIGKIGIPEKVLNKPNRLNDEEYEIIKSHVQNSIGIIRHLPSIDYVIPAVIGHHERWDGKGYPRRIEGEDIPLFARILCIADSFDAMISKRVYKEAMSVSKALDILISEAGKQFDPHLSALFVEGVKKGEIIPHFNSFGGNSERLDA